ncbi:hypothetical protein C8R45DRAFT_931708 [Mycena sanguinolenta]|nr:hypothetical protein C8R45DRAFT_931708 [Mycena sanguinolenta]
MDIDFNCHELAPEEADARPLCGRAAACFNYDMLTVLCQIVALLAFARNLGAGRDGQEEWLDLLGHRSGSLRSESEGETRERFRGKGRGAERGGVAVASSLLGDRYLGRLSGYWTVQVNQKVDGKVPGSGVRYGRSSIRRGSGDNLGLMWKVFTGDELTLELSSHWSRRSSWFACKKVIP